MITYYTVHEAIVSYASSLCREIAAASKQEKDQKEKDQKEEEIMNLVPKATELYNHVEHLYHQKRNRRKEEEQSSQPTTTSSNPISKSDSSYYFFTKKNHEHLLSAVKSSLS
mmetsp:Transcript_3342/g.4891  ORF Transcript_3342/g.4891 Transcript_3342/m.4891 type:complete len:112 (+) Transcript_3342:350-685(+)